MKLDLSMLKNPRVAVPVVVVGVGIGYLLTRRSSSAASSSTAGAQSPVEDPLASGVLPGTGGGIPSSGPSSRTPAPPADGEATTTPVPDSTVSPIGSSGFVRAPAPTSTVTPLQPQPRVPIVGQVPLAPGDLVPNDVPPGSIYGTRGYFDNGNANGYSDRAIEEGGNRIVALGAPQANAAIAVNDAAGNPQTIIQNALGSPGSVNHGNGPQQVVPGSTSSAHLAAMLAAATPEQLASQEWRDTWNAMNAEDGGSARL